MNNTSTREMTSEADKARASGCLDKGPKFPAVASGLAFQGRPFLSPAMFGVDIAAAERVFAGRMALMGNVACNLLEDGPEAALRFPVRYFLEQAGRATSSVHRKNWGPCFSTSDWNPDYLDFGGIEKYRDGLSSEKYHLLCCVWAIHNGIVLDDKRDAVLHYIKNYNGYGLELAAIGQCLFFDTMYPLGTEGERLLAFLKHPHRWVRMIPNYCATERADGGVIPLAVLPNAPGTMLPRYVGGVRPTAPGFSQFDVKPSMDGLEHASVTVPTVKGMVKAEWKKPAETPGFTLKTTIPVNTVAHLYLSKQGLSSITVREGDALVWQNGKFRSGTQGVNHGQDAEWWIKLTVGSGEYSFTVRENRVMP